MRRTSWIWLAVAACAGSLPGCGEAERVDALVDASDPSEPFDPPPDDDTDPLDAGTDVPPGPSDAATPDAGKDASWPDPEPERDGGHSFDCEEEFVWDPQGRTDVVSVVVASGYLSGWNPGSSPALTLGDDGKWRASVPMVAIVMPYKFVINGSEWLADPDACHRASDGFGGENSVRYACQEAPPCPGDGDAGVELDAGSDAGADAGAPDAATPDAAAPDAAAPDAAVPADDAGSDDMDASAEPDAAADAGAVDECPCVHTAWIDLDGKPGVFADDILEVVLAGSHRTLGSWDPGYSSVVLAPAGEGVWFARVAPPAEATEYKVVVRHRQHPPAWLLDDGNCLPRRSGNNVMVACDAQPAACTPAAPAVELAGSEVDLCTRCEVTVEVPFSALEGLADAESVVLHGEQAPLSWGSGFALTRGTSAFTATFSVPRGRHEYQLKVDDGELGRDPAACGATPNGANSFLYGCYAAPSCD